MSQFGVDRTRVVHPLFQEEDGGSTPASTLQLKYGHITTPTFIQMNSLWHSTLPKVGGSRFRVCYGAEFGNVWYAVAAWSNPVARQLPQQTWLELRRFAIAPDAPKNTASSMLSWMRRDIKKMFPDIERLISYQDINSHSGTIYKASGWEQAKNYRIHTGKYVGWDSRIRPCRTGNPTAPRMRWEYVL